MPTEQQTKVLDYATKAKGKPVGRGSCWDLPHKALTEGAEAKSAGDYGKVTDTSNDRWGKSISLEQAQPGDILQFDNHIATRTVVKKTTIVFPEMRSIFYEEENYRTFERKHHSAIVASRLEGVVMTVLEQHVNRGRGVVENTVGDGTIYVDDSKKVLKSTERVKISPAWARHVKKLSPENAAGIDALLRSYDGKTFEAETETTQTIEVTGTINAFTPESKSTEGDKVKDPKPKKAESKAGKSTKPSKQLPKSNVKSKK